jgi:hypothetical protein
MIQWNDTTLWQAVAPAPAAACCAVRQVLSPTKQFDCPCGTAALNQSLHPVFNPLAKNYKYEQRSNGIEQEV